MAIATAKDAISKKVADPLQASGPLFSKFVDDYRRAVPFPLRLRLGMLPLLDLGKVPQDMLNGDFETDDLAAFKTVLGDARDVALQVSKMVIRFF